MGYTALYREWRPQNFNDIVGQEYITTTLKNQILNDRIAHAYLFCGTRGTGKTSTAKVFAKALNCLNLIDGEPCNECEVCTKINQGLSIDVTELDAASNNGIDRIRDIIDDVKYPPQETKYKVYIMDEVHMLSMGAVNAFLKTLEEPPSNVIFILATTDPQKLPITILSRCQRFDFKRISNKEITARLRKIVTEQAVMADDKSLNLIARVSDGAMRDSLSILDQAISMGDGAIQYDTVISMLGLVTNEFLFKIGEAIIQRNIEKCITIIDDVVLEGKDMHLFIKDLTTHYRNLLMAKVTNNPEEVLDMSEENVAMIKEQASRIRTEEIMRGIRILQEAESNAKLSKQARIYLELAIIKMCKIEYDTSNEVIVARMNKLEEDLKKGNIAIPSVALEGNSQGVQAQSAPVAAKTKPIAKPKIDYSTEGNKDSKIRLDDVKRAWRDILESFKNRRAMVIYASIVPGKPVNCQNGIVTILFADEYKFSKSRLDKEEYRKIINEVFSETLREPIRVNFEVEEEGSKSTADQLVEMFGEEAIDVIDE